MAHSVDAEVKKYFESLRQKVTNLSNGMMEMEEDWKMPFVTISGDKDKSLADGAMEAIMDDFRDIKRKTQQLKENIETMSKEVKEFSNMAEAEFKNLQMNQNDFIILFKEHGYTMNNEDHSKDNTEESNERNSILNSNEMNSEITDESISCIIRDGSNLPCSTPLTRDQKR